MAFSKFADGSDFTGRMKNRDAARYLLRANTAASDPELPMPAKTYKGRS